MQITTVLIPKHLLKNYLYSYGLFQNFNLKVDQLIV